MPFGTVISASRRTDIPAFYMPWFMNCLEHGSVDVKNPFNGVISRIDLRPEKVHSIVFWSKNYGPFLDGCYAEKIAAQGYRMFFQFTLNTSSEIFEPYIPSFELRVAQMRQLRGLEIIIIPLKGELLCSTNKAPWNEVDEFQEQLSPCPKV